MRKTREHAFQERQRRAIRKLLIWAIRRINKFKRTEAMTKEDEEVFCFTVKSSGAQRTATNSHITVTKTSSLFMSRLWYSSLIQNHKAQSEMLYFLTVTYSLYHSITSIYSEYRSFLMLYDRKSIFLCCFIVRWYFKNLKKYNLKTRKISLT